MKTGLLFRKWYIFASVRYPGNLGYPRYEQQDFCFEAEYDLSEMKVFFFSLNIRKP